MVRKCGFFDCNNQVEKDNSCQSCKERKEDLVCSACRQKPEAISKLEVQGSLLIKKYLYEMVVASRNQIPIQYHQLKTEFDKLLPQIKLSAEEKKLIQEMEKFISELLAEKGGKQDHID